MYVNIEQLSGVLRQYNPAHPYYIGAWHWFGHVCSMHKLVICVIVHMLWVFVCVFVYV